MVMNESIYIALIEDAEGDNNHFAWIKNISRLRNHLSTDSKNNSHKNIILIIVMPNH
jgi:hypothetical protein